MKLLVKQPVKSQTEGLPEKEPCCPETDLPAPPLNEHYLPNGLQLSPHAQKRASMRGITPDMIENTVRYGIKTCKQGLCFYYMPSRYVQSTFTPKHIKNIANVVVVVRRPGIVVTVYKNQKAMRNIKKKPKRLYCGHSSRRIQLKRILG